jgi:hypothetical protein
MTSMKTRYFSVSRNRHFSLEPSQKKVLTMLMRPSFRHVTSDIKKLNSPFIFLFCLLSSYHHVSSKTIRIFIIILNALRGCSMPILIFSVHILCRDYGSHTWHLPLIGWFSVWRISLRWGNIMKATSSAALCVFKMWQDIFYEHSKWGWSCSISVMKAGWKIKYESWLSFGYSNAHRVAPTTFWRRRDQIGIQYS